ncbi:nuclear transport factor 2 family protein [Actinomycetospora sp.]|uniref:nuclear transport factor 2 family protein n=1 Tax=Actinomycetospora sp. TaxID=1872135 RepID=UPI0039C863D5
MSRTPQQIFAHHAEALVAGDIDGIVSDYSDDAVFITAKGVLHGKDGVRKAFTDLLDDLPNASWEVPVQVYEGDVLYIEWAAVAASSQATDGVDTFVFDGDSIRVQTVRYSLQER